MAVKKKTIRNPRSSLVQNVILQNITNWPKIARSKAKRTAARVRAQGDKIVNNESDSN